MLDRFSPFIAKPRITPEHFRVVMEQKRSPWTDRSEALYELITSEGHDPAVWLGIGLREHGLLTDPRAVALKLDTNSWTNARSVRLPGLDYDLITTSDLRKAGITDRDGPYVRYRSVEDSLRDGMHRVTDPGYVYWQRRAVRIGDVLNIWTEDDGPAYTSFVLTWMNAWMDALVNEIVPFSWLDDPLHEYVPELNGEFGYPANTTGRQGRKVELLIMHITIGNNSLAYLNGGNGNSAHYLSHKDGTPRAQMISESDAAWAAGNKEYNLAGIQYEHEKRYVDDPWTHEMYVNLAKSASRIIERNPGILVDRNHIIGHNEVPDPLNPGRFGGVGNHVDPGWNFDWNLFMALIAEHAAGVNPNAEEFPTGHWIINVGGVDMLDFWRSAGGLEICGMPMGGMVEDPDGVYRQLCENVLLECWPAGFGHYPGPHYRFGGLGQRYHREVISGRA